MNGKLNRIERFIESLPNDVETPEATTVLLPSKMDLTGGTSKNGGHCSNSSLDKCKGSSNGGNCFNAQFMCNNSTNEGSCFDDSHLTPVNPASC